MAAWKSTLELGELIVSTPELLKEIERLVVDGWLLMPRGRRVKLTKALAKVREHQAASDVRVAELANAPAGQPPTGIEGSNPSPNDTKGEA